MASSPRITPHLWFDKEAKEAAAFYCSVFPNSKITHQSTIEGVPTPSGNCDIVAFELGGQPFMAISAGPTFKFSEAVSFLIPCETQAEIDYYWEKLSADREAGQCGWLKDKYGLSWQAWPRVIGEMIEKGAPEQVARVTKAMLMMKKFDIAALEAAYRG
ncbi:MAG: VOC family protein [Alphaproteobacteria bacterium]|nr:VOC family protein [Alphaproteobacteria bacterium]